MKAESSKKVLLLNANHTPVGLVTRRKAMDLVMFRGKAMLLAEYEDGAGDYYNFAVVRLTVKTPDPYVLLKRAKVSKRDIFKRDNFLCVYCGKKLAGKELTVDHVIPRSRGGANTPDNLKTCCRACNSYKDNLTPEEAGMRIIYGPHSVTSTKADVFKLYPLEWHPFLEGHKIDFIL